MSFSATPSWGSPIYQDGVFTSPVPAGLPVGASPIPSVTIISSGTTSYNPEYTLTQANICSRTSYAPTALNTLHPDFSSLNSSYTGPNFYLVAEGERQDIGGGLVKWNMIWSAVPASWNEWETYTYSFIGLLGITLTSGSNSYVWPGRNRISRKVNSRVQHDYFLVNPALSSDSPPVYASPGNIPRIWAMPYCGQVTWSGTIYGGIVLPLNTLTSVDCIPSWGASGSSLTTNPPGYEAMIQNAVTYGWGTGSIVTNLVILTSQIQNPIDMTNSVFGGQIPVEDAQLKRFHGNIYERVSRYVLAA
jgi:hypothetical protein